MGSRVEEIDIRCTAHPGHQGLDNNAVFHDVAQERRIDLPTIGKKTLDGAAAAGLAGIGYEAGGALIVDVETVKSHAEALGPFLYGFPQDWGT